MMDGHGVEHAGYDESSSEDIALLARRARAYQRSRDPRDLWPDVSERDIQCAADVIGHVVSGALVDRRAELRHANAEALGIAALILGVGPLLGYWIEIGHLRADADVGRILGRHLRHGRLRAALIGRAMKDVVAALNASDIRPAIMKGFHTGHVWFPEPGIRPCADVDVVVRPDEVGRASDVLRRMGYVEGAGQPRPYKREWRAPDQDEHVRSFHFWHWRSKWNIELHDDVTFGHTLGHGVRFGVMNRFDDSCALLEGVRVASGAPLVAMLAVHASGELYGSRLLRLVELVLVVRAEAARTPSLWQDVHKLLLDANALRFAYPAFHLAEQLVPGTIDGEVLAASALASTSRARGIVPHYTPTSPILQSSTSLSERLMWAKGGWAVLRRLGMMITPVENAPLPATMAAYASRLHRVFAGRVGWRVRPRNGMPR